MSHLLRKAALSAIGGSLLVATLGLAPAGAEKPDTPPGQARRESQAVNDADKPADRHERDAARDRDGDADADPATSYTEDDDTNDDTPNNVVDDGDNAHPSGNDRSVEHGGSGNQGRSEADPDDDGRGPDRHNGGADKPDGPGGDDLADQDGNNGCGNDDDFEDDNEGWCGKPAHAGPAPEPEVKPDVEPAHQSDDDECDEGAMGDDESCEEKADEDDVEDDDHVVSVKPGTVDRDLDVDTECPDAGELDADDDMPVGCELPATDDTEVLGSESTRGGAAVAETPASTVSARSAGGGVLASLAGVPVVGSVIEGELPFTGISTLGFLIVAMAAMVIGLLLVRASRKAGATS